MSGGSKQQYKQFSINSLHDACLALGMLITGVNVNDKLLFRQREILQLTADHQSSSFSYIDLRKLLEKNQYLSSSLS